jgi:predicted transposase YbfD/YdcC
MNENIRIQEYFSDVETTAEHNGYFCSVGETLTIVIPGSLCGLRNVSQIHQWAQSERTRMFLLDRFGISKVPCYYWMLCLLKIIKPKSLNQCFINWVQSFLPDGREGMTISFDGKTIRSTGKMDKYESPLHIVSAHLADLGITYGQYAVEDKSNEIPAVRELIGILDISGCMIVADAMHCQKETAKAILGGKADYLLSAKDNRQTLKEEIEDYVQDEGLRKTMDSFSSIKKQGGRIERRVAYSTGDTEWLFGKEEWPGLVCVGAVNTQFTTKKGVTNEWHYYISSRGLTAEALLKHARLEWSVESMHWLLDMHFGEDFCRVEDKNVQENLNIVRKIALNSVKTYKENSKSKNALSRIMFDCLLDCETILSILTAGGGGGGA